MILLVFLMTVYSQLPCAQNCSIGAEHGISADCSATAASMTLYWLMPGTPWEPVATKPCVPGERVRFDPAKYLAESLPEPGLIAYRVSASNAAGESLPTAALVTLYEGGVTVLP